MNVSTINRLKNENKDLLYITIDDTGRIYGHKTTPYISHNSNGDVSFESYDKTFLGEDSGGTLGFYNLSEFNISEI